MNMRVGIGYDAHQFTGARVAPSSGKATGASPSRSLCSLGQFAADRPLVLGGVTIPAARGLAGHSDADVLLHAVMDALLGAAGLGDIGAHFPNTDPQYQNISSLELLRQVCGLLRAGGWVVGNVDVTVVAEQPKLVPHFPAMRDRMAPILGIPAAQVGLKATTNEGMGFIGRGEGMAAMAVVLLQCVSA